MISSQTPAAAGGSEARCIHFRPPLPSNADLPGSSARRICVALLLFVVGCGVPPAPFGNVTGQVTFEGKEVPHATVIFEAIGTQLSITADADDAGHYQARRSAEMAGLPPGDYRVAITPPLFYPGLGPAGAAPPERADIPRRYRDPATSRLSLTVLDGEDHRYDVRMAR